MISLGLNLWSTTILARGGSVTDGYAVAGFSPSLVFDFSSEFYRTGGSTTTFDAAMTHTRSGNATMVDSDGVLKWAPHNLMTYSQNLTQWSADSGATIVDEETFSTIAGGAGVTNPNATSLSAGKYTAELELWSETDAGKFVDFGFSTSNGTNTFSAPVELQSTPTVYSFDRVETATPGVSIRIRNQDLLAKTVKVRNVRIYRSDLGGMVDNPDTGNSYVPTTSAARYLPRRGHHIYNGAEWVNEGVLVESEARTNLITYSNTLDDASFTGISATVTTAYADSPLGANTATRLIDNGATGSAVVGHADVGTTVATSSVYTFWVFLKADQLSWAYLEARSFTTPGNVQTYFDLANGVVGTVGAGHTPHMSNYGNGWYLCGITFTTDVADTSGQPRVYVAEADATIGVERDGTSSILMAGWQFEAGSTPSSYIPTSGSTATRSADTITVPSANLPWPTPNVIGEELVPDASTWTGSANWSVDTGTGTATVVSASSSGDDLSFGTLSTSSLQQQFLIQFTVNSISGGGVNIGGSRLVQTAYATTVGTYSFVTQASITGGGSFTVNISAGGVSAVVSNISVREIDPLSVSIQMDGKMTYADTNASTEVQQWRWDAGADEMFVQVRGDAGTGQQEFRQVAASVVDNLTSGGSYYSPGINVPFNIASRHGSTFINGSVDGVALTANLTPTALPDLSSTNLNLAFDYMGTIKTFRVWSDDLGDAGIALASDTIVAVPAGAIQQRDGAYILDRSGNYIEVRA